MATNEQTSKMYFRGLMIIYLSIIMAQVIFGLICLYLDLSTPYINDMDDLNKIFQVFVPLLIAGGSISGIAIFSNRIKTIKEKTVLKDKLRDYRTALIIRYALLEGPSLFSLVCFLIIGNYLYIGLSGFIILYFLTIKPSRENLANDLELNPDDRAILENPDAIVSSSY